MELTSDDEDYKTLKEILESIYDDVSKLNENCQDFFLELYDDYYYLQFQTACVGRDWTSASEAISHIRRSNSSYQFTIGLEIFGTKDKFNTIFHEGIYRKARACFRNAGNFQQYYQIRYGSIKLDNKASSTFSRSYIKFKHDYLDSIPERWLDQFDKLLEPYSDTEKPDPQTSPNFFSGIKEPIPLTVVAELIDALEEKLRSWEELESIYTEKHPAEPALKTLIETMKKGFIGPCLEKQKTDMEKCKKDHDIAESSTHNTKPI